MVELCAIFLNIVAAVEMGTKALLTYDFHSVVRSDSESEIRTPRRVTCHCF